LSIQTKSPKNLLKLNEAPEIQNSFTSFDATFPQYMIHIDYDMAAKKGVSVDNAMSTLQTMLDLIMPPTLFV
jgi:multidrug efflux pump subunit AcrB